MFCPAARGRGTRTCAGWGMQGDLCTVIVAQLRETSPWFSKSRAGPCSHHMAMNNPLFLTRAHCCAQFVACVSRQRMMIPPNVRCDTRHNARPAGCLQCRGSMRTETTCQHAAADERNKRGNEKLRHPHAAHVTARRRVSVDTHAPRATMPQCGSLNVWCPTCDPGHWCCPGWYPSQRPSLGSGLPP